MKINRRYRIWLISGVILTGVMAYAFTKQPHLSETSYLPLFDPPSRNITWTPATVDLTMFAGETLTLPVSFVSSDKLSNVFVQIDAQLPLLVEVSPSSIRKVVAGESYTLQLKISAPANTPPESLKAVVQLSGRNPSRVFSPTLPITAVTTWETTDDTTLSYSLSYPPSWTANVRSPDAVELLGQLGDSSQPKPSAFDGLCKVSVTVHDNPELLPLPDWLAQAAVETKALAPMSSDPITVSGVNGIRELIEENGMTTTIYIPKADKVYSLELICGSDVITLGDSVFTAILDSFTFK